MHQSNPFTNTSINASSVRETLEDYQALWESDRDIRFVIEIVTETLWDDFDPTGVAKVSDSVISKVRSVPQLCKDDAEDDRRKRLLNNLLEGNDAPNKAYRFPASIPSHATNPAPWWLVPAGSCCE